MNPQTRLSRVDQLLTNVSLAYVNQNYIADEVLPIVPNLKNDSGLIGSYSNDHLRIYSAKRSLYDVSQKRIEWKYQQDDRYDIDYFDLETFLPDRLVEQTELPFNARRDAMLVVMESLKVERERSLAAIMSDTSILTQNSTLSGTSQWSDYANSEPEVDIRNARTAVFNATGMEANCIQMSRATLEVLKLHPFFLNQVRGVRLPSEDDVISILKSFFGFTKVLIGRAKYVSSKEGQTDVMADVWGKDLVIYYAPQTPSLMQKSFGYSFQLAGRNWTVRTRREPDSDEGELIKVQHARDDKILVPTAAYLYKSVVA
mgnify:FL=1